MSSEETVVLEVQEEDNEEKTKDNADARAEADALSKIEAELANQQKENKVLSTQAEQQLDNEIRATIHRNLIRQHQINYLQRLRQHRQKKRRFGLKFK